MLFMTFKTDYRNYTTRYALGPGIVLLMILYFFLRSLGEESMEFSKFVYALFFRDKESLTFLFSILAACQIAGVFSTQKCIKTFKLKKDLIVISFFNKKIINIKYKDIKSIEFTKDSFKHFKFMFKNGKTKKIYATIENKEKALEEIKKRIPK
jgi:hypothetical protein